MDTNNILRRVDHTLLKAFATWDEIAQLCEESIKYHTASVCIPPSFISKVKETYGDQINICTVIGFPLGYNTTESKVFEVKDAILKGASEVDMVINIGDAKMGRFDCITEEIHQLKEASGDKILKVIIETCYLTEAEIIALCKCVTDAKADYIKTSTGFGTAGATRSDVLLFKAHVGPDVRIKAAGGMKNLDDIEMFVNEGCDRLGTSSAISILKSNGLITE